MPDSDKNEIFKPLKRETNKVEQLRQMPDGPITIAIRLLRIKKYINCLCLFLMIILSYYSIIKLHNLIPDSFIFDYLIQILSSVLISLFINVVSNIMLNNILIFYKLI